MVRKRASRQSRRLHRLELEGIDLAPGGAFSDVDELMTAARRILRDEGLRWRAVPYGAVGSESRRRHAMSLRNVRLVPPTSARITPARAWEIAYALRARRDVRAAEPSFVMPAEGPYRPARRRGAAPEDEHASCSGAAHWSIDFSRIPQAWQVPLPGDGDHLGKDIVVAHPDTGYRLHDELVGSLIDVGAGYDFVDEDADALDPLHPPNAGHGTSTASVIVSGVEAPPVEAVTGAAPLASLIPLRVSNSVVHFSWSRLTDAIYHAIAQGAHVVSMSLGGPLPSFALHDALVEATGAGVILVAAAGNQWPFVVFPARYDEVIAVAASNCRDERWAWSASGGDVDITAPGESVWRAEVTSSGAFKVSRSSGTSYATAQLAGVAALWLAHHGRANLVAKYGVANVPVVFKELLTLHGFRWPASGTWDTANLGVGLVDAHALLAAPLPSGPHAAGMHMRGTARATTIDVTDWIASYFPRAETARVRAWLMRQFGVRERALAGALATLGAELAFHITSDPATYAALHAQLAGRRGAVAVPRQRLFGRASRTFKAALA
jgi:hypothetical protein